MEIEPDDVRNLTDTGQGSVTRDHRSQRVPRNRSRKGAGLNLQAVAEVLDSEGLNPATELLRIMKEGAIDDSLRARIWIELLEYVQPKLRAVEHKGEVRSVQYVIRAPDVASSVTVWEHENLPQITQ